MSVSHSPVFEFQELLPGWLAGWQRSGYDEVWLDWRRENQGLDGGVGRWPFTCSGNWSWLDDLRGFGYWVKSGDYYCMGLAINSGCSARAVLAAIGYIRSS